jgi:diguanylate cyclase (GGDEF)-like protein/PAS domain S-box-containing protein
MAVEHIPSTGNHGGNDASGTSPPPEGRHLFDAMHTALAFVNSDGYCEYANAPFLQLLDCTEADLAHQPLHDLVHFNDATCPICHEENCRLVEALRDFDAAGREFEVIFVRHTGLPFIAACKTRSVPRGAGFVTVLEVLDVTGERRIDLDAMVREPSYQFAADAARIGSWSRDFQSDAISICPIMASLLELPSGHALLSDRQWRNMIHDDDLASVDARMAQFMATGENFELEYRVRTGSGRQIWLSSRGTVVKDAAGNPVSASGMTIDITAKKELEEAIRASEERFRLLAEMSPSGILVIVDGCFAYANQAAADILGVTDAASVAGKALLDLFDERYHERIAARIEEVLAEGHTPIPETELRRLDGSRIWVQPAAGMTTWEGKPAIQVIVRDITEEKQTREKLRILNERISLALESAGEAVWEWDLRKNAYTFSGGLRNLFAWSAEMEASASFDWRTMVHPDDLTSLEATVEACVDGSVATYLCEFRLRAADDEWRWVVTRGIAASRDRQGRALVLTGTMTDITARKEADDLAWRNANLDSLTGLPNRRLYQERLELEIHKAERSGRPFALLFIDLDRFKQVNDWLGHAAGDQLLIDASHRIRHCVRRTDTVARVGGDEFTVLLVDLDGPRHVEFVCQKIISELVEPFLIGQESAHISCSIGVAVYPMDATTTKELMRKADQAMYSAKENGKQQFRYFTKAMDDIAHRRLRITNELRSAIRKGQMSVHYQPVIRLSDGHVVKAEALARWTHPRLGIVEPSEFIPLAEEAGLIGLIGDWVLEQAVAQSSRWHDDAGITIQIGINQSPLQFAMRNAKSERIHTLVENGMAGSNISIEITEGTLLDASPHVKEKLLLYRDAGIQVAIDDFGTGYSSLAYLQQFDIDYLKIDQSFVHDIDSNDANRTIVETIIMMAHKLGLQVIAEGIETEEQAAHLTAAGCDFGQGFLFSPAVPAAEFERILTSGGLAVRLPMQ